MNFVHRRLVGVEELDAGAVARAGLRHLERRPGNHRCRCESALGLSARMKRTRWFGFRIVGETTCAPTSDRLISAAGLPSICTSTPSTILNRGARRVPVWSSGAATATARRGRCPPTGVAAHVVPSPLSCETMRISHSVSDGSALMRLMSAVPRDVAAKSRSSATTFGRCRVIRSSALSASVSAKATTSPSSFRSLRQAKTQERQSGPSAAQEVSLSQLTRRFRPGKQCLV